MSPFCININGMDMPYITFSNGKVKQKKARAEFSARAFVAIKSEITNESDYYCREKFHHFSG